MSGATFYDGLCLLHLLLGRDNHSLTINVENLREDIEKVCLHQFSNNVDDLLIFIEGKYQKIQDINKTLESAKMLHNECSLKKMFVHCEILG